jgi:hypothetical protein
MRRITITPEIEALADAYKKCMLYKTPHNGVVSRACSNLRFLGNCLQNGSIIPLTEGVRYVEYIRKIEQSYIELLLLHPGSFGCIAEEFNRIVGVDHLADVLEVSINRQGETVATHPVKFYELLVWAMRYDYVQSRVFPDIIRTLGIRTCVYCNAQYAIATRKNEAFYQLDHCYPKSLYPFLSTSFFNLQPSCGSCNQRKSGLDMRKGNYDVSMWKEANDINDSYFDFHIENGSLAQYMVSHDRDDLDIDVINTIKGEPDLDELLDLFKERFQTKEVYQEHREEVEEVIWKKYVYTATYVDSLHVAFKDTFIDKSGELKRLLLGTYPNPKDVYKRPLTKMVQDVAKQLKIDTLMK